MSKTLSRKVKRPPSIALDINGGKMYWTDVDTDKIQRANLDGSNVEDLVTTGLGNPDGIALDLSDGKMYWTDWEANKIQRANLNGSNIEDLVTEGLSDPNVIALDISGGKMVRCTGQTDGSNVEDLVTGLGDPRGIALDISKGKMYWTDTRTHKIQRATSTAQISKTSSLRD